MEILLTERLLTNVARLAAMVAKGPSDCMSETESCTMSLEELMDWIRECRQRSSSVALCRDRRGTSETLVVDFANVVGIVTNECVITCNDAADYAQVYEVLRKLIAELQST